MDYNIISDPCLVISELREALKHWLEYPLNLVKTSIFSVTQSDNKSHKDVLQNWFLPIFN